MSVAEDESIAGFSHAISASSKGTKSSSNSQVEFADVVEKLSFAIENVRQLKPWKDRALRAERENRQLHLSLTMLKDELTDCEYEVDKWKKRALRAEQENQDEIIKWKNKARGIRSSNELRDDVLPDDEAIDMLGVDEGETYTNLVTEGDGDNSTISTQNDDHGLTGVSFRSKWKKLGFAEEKRDPEQDDDESVALPVALPVHDDSSTVAAEELVRSYEQGTMFGPKKSFGKTMADDSSSAIEAEEILNNYLSMKGRFKSRRFDSSNRSLQQTTSKYSNSSGAVHNAISEEVEI